MATKSEEIARKLAARIGEGREFPPGSTLPGFSELTEHYGVSRLTISRAIELLSQRGLVRSVKKSGTRVLQQAPRRTVHDAVQRQGGIGYLFPTAAATDGPWTLHGPLTVARLPLPEDAADFLGVPAGTEALRRRRVSSPVGEPPFQLADSWLHPEELEGVAGLDEWHAGPGGYMDRIEEAGHGPLTWKRFVRHGMPTTEEAQLLEVSRQLPVWRQYTVSLSARTSEPLEVTVVVIPGDRVEYATTLRRDGTARWPVESIALVPQSFDVG